MLALALSHTNFVQSVNKGRDSPTQAQHCTRTVREIVDGLACVQSKLCTDSLDARKRHPLFLVALVEAFALRTRDVSGLGSHRVRYLHRFVDRQLHGTR